jgi:protein disulfide-isomerase
MHKHMILIAILLALTVLTNVRAQESTNTWLTDFNMAKKEATEKKLPILANFSGCDWCGWCIKLEKEVFSQKEFRTFAKDRVVLFRACFPDENRPKTDVDVQNEQLLQTYSVEGFPTVLLLDAGGKIVARTGYRRGGAGAYVDHLKDLLKQTGNK